MLVWIGSGLKVKARQLVVVRVKSWLIYYALEVLTKI